MRRLLLLFVLAALSGCDNDVPILLYHWEGASPGSPWDVAPENLRAQLDELKAGGYTTITLGELFDYRDGTRKLPRRPVVITFDDGDRSFHDVAYPLLKERGMRAELFLIEGLVRETDAERATWTGMPMLIWPEVQEMVDSGVVIVESHSRTHTKMTAKNSDELRDELLVSRERLRSRLGAEVDFFAYPGHNHNAAVMDAVRDNGYRGAVAGSNRMGTRFDLFRYTVYDKTDIPGFRRLLARDWADAYEDKYQEP